MTKSWFCKVELKFKFNWATPECRQDPLFLSWMEQLNAAILSNPRPNAGQAARVDNAGGNNDKSDN